MCVPEPSAGMERTHYSIESAISCVLQVVVDLMDFARSSRSSRSASGSLIGLGCWLSIKWRSGERILLRRILLSRGIRLEILVLSLYLVMEGVNRGPSGGSRAQNNSHPLISFIRRTNFYTGALKRVVTIHRPVAIFGCFHYRLAFPAVPSDFLSQPISHYTKDTQLRKFIPVTELWFRLPSLVGPVCLFGLCFVLCPGR